MLRNVGFEVSAEHPDGGIQEAVVYVALELGERLRVRYIDLRSCVNTTWKWMR